MCLTSLVISTSFCALVVSGSFLPPAVNNGTTTCPAFEKIDNAIVQIETNGYEQIAVVSCEEGYDLDGSPNVYCIQGVWEKFPRPQCTKRCPPPPYIKNGSLEIDRSKDENGLFRKGTLVTYSCGEGFTLSPKESEYRVCEKGIWTGPYASCASLARITGCPVPKSIANGYFVHEKVGTFEGNSVGQRLHFSCRSGYVLIGAPVQQCLDDGSWSPRIPPVCSPQITGNIASGMIIIDDNSKWNRA